MSEATPQAQPTRILVTGAAGQLGRDVMRTAAAAGHDALGVDSALLDVTDGAAVTRAVAEYGPEAIIHCAAWTAVDDAEAQVAAAHAVNEAGSRNVARAARSVGAYVVGVSTDYVFDGTNPEGYAEGDATNPLSVYGASKLAGEQALLQESPHSCIARTAWLFGADGTNFVRTIARLATERESIDVVTDQRGCPTWTSHLADALVRCVEGRITGVLHLVDAPVATWFELAEEAVRTLGVSCEVRPTTSDKFPRPAPRPACSILRATRPETPAMGDWRDGVRAVLRQAAQPSLR